LLVIVPRAAADAALRTLPEARQVGEVVQGSEVQLV
jgi:hypothetical protein